MASLTLLSELMNYDFSAHGLDEEVTDELVESKTGIRGLVENLRAHIGGGSGSGTWPLTGRPCCRGRAS